MNYILATSVKNEGLYLLEWLSHHLNLGFNKVIIYSNDNTDGSDELLECLDQENHIDWRPRIIEEGESPQKTAFNNLSKELFETDDGSYLMWLDCDEFLVLHKHNCISELLSSYNFPDVLSINWKHFGSSSKKHFENDLTVNRFKKCSENSELNKQIKSITKINKAYYKSIHHHRPVPKYKENYGRIIHAAPLNQGDILVDSKIVHGKRAIDLDNSPIYHDVCQINHYAIRSENEYTIKKQRGGGWAEKGKKTKRYEDNFFKTRDLNEKEDLTASSKYSVEINNKLKSFSEKIQNTNNKILQKYKQQFSEMEVEVEKNKTPTSKNEIEVFDTYYDNYDFRPWEFTKNANEEEKLRQHSYQSFLKGKYPVVIGSECFISEKAFVCPQNGERLNLGNKSWIGAHVYISGKISIGRNCSLNPFSTIRGPFKCGNNVRIASYTSIIGFNHGHKDINKPMTAQKSTHKGVVFGDDIWVGAHVTVLEGVTVGSHSVLAAGAVVTKDVPEYAVVGGSPAKILYMRNEQDSES